MDERDAGVIYVTHFTLLLGLALPVWCTLALPGSDAFLTSQLLQRGGGSSAGASSAAQAGTLGVAATAAAGEQQHKLLQVVLAGLSGIMIVGVGDTFASVVGKLLGRSPVHAASKKTLEGTGAGTLLTLAAWWVMLRLAPIGALTAQQWASLAACTAGAGVLEAITSQLDNIMIPMFYLAHVLLV